MDVATLLYDRYEILSTLADETATTTYLALDRTSKNQVAIKCLAFQRVKDWKAWELFEREANILKTLNHPKIPTYIDFFKTDDEYGVRLYLVREFIEGHSLAQLLQEGRHFSEQDAIDIAIQISAILEYLHSFSPSILHRDIKPGNIILTSHNTIFLIDFGAVRDKLLHDQAILGGGSTIVGTYGYMPVEQFQGRALPASDIYSLGMTLIHLLSGIFPADIENKDGCLNFRPHMTVSSPFADVLQKMISPESVKRYSDATQLVTDLRAVLDGKPRRKSHHILNILRNSLCVVMGLWLAWLILKLFLPSPPPVPISIPQQPSEHIQTAVQEEHQPDTAIDTLLDRSRAHFLSRNEDIEAVINAIKTGKLLRGLALSDPIRQQGTSAIREIIYGVHERQRLHGHQDTVACVAFSPDGTVVASAGTDDQQIVIWSIPDGRELYRLEGHSGSVWNLAFHPESKLLASGSFDGTVKVWDIERGREVLTILTPLGEVFGVVWSPDGAHILAGGSAGNGAIKIWDSTTGEDVALLQGSTPMVRSLALSHDGTLLAVGGIFGGQIEVWDVRAHDKRSAIPSGHSKSISHLAFNGDDSLLASGAKDRTVEIWDMTAGKQFLKLEGTPGNVVKFSPDSRLLAVGHGQNGTLSLWRVADGSPVETFKKTAATYLYSIDFTPDGQLLASGQDSGVVKLWSVETLEEQHTLHKTSETHWENTTGMFKAQANTEGIAIWGWQSSQELGRVPIPDISGAEIIVTSPDGNWRASVAYGESITLQNRSTNTHTILDKHVNTITSVQFSPDNLLLASGSTDRTIRLWNLQEGRDVAVLHGHTDGVTSVNFSQDGTKLFSLSDDGSIKIWELDLDAIIEQGCDWIQGYLDNNPDVNTEDREICSHP